MCIVVACRENKGVGRLNPLFGGDVPKMKLPVEILQIEHSPRTGFLPFFGRGVNDRSFINIAQRIVTAGPGMLEEDRGDDREN
jgi:hypothetical protein